mmetsp:Transcript_9099/g.29912  ORF Transcript_9099/g.29912 Transcript_9099/m.29912 type:complete len:310 (+) Transcript_9099:694-1623(+)
MREKDALERVRERLDARKQSSAARWSRPRLRPFHELHEERLERHLAQFQNERHKEGNCPSLDVIHVRLAHSLRSCRSSAHVQSLQALAKDGIRVRARGAWVHPRHCGFCRRQQFDSRAGTQAERVLPRGEERREEDSWRQSLRQTSQNRIRHIRDNLSDSRIEKLAKDRRQRRAHKPRKFTVQDGREHLQSTLKPLQVRVILLPGFFRIADHVKDPSQNRWKGRHEAHSFLLSDSRKRIESKSRNLLAVHIQIILFLARLCHRFVGIVTRYGLHSRANHHRRERCSGPRRELCKQLPNADTGDNCRGGS